MMALGTTDLFSGQQAPGSLGQVMLVSALTTAPIPSDVLVEIKDHGRLTVLPDGTWTYGTSGDGAWQQGKRSGSLLIFHGSDGVTPRAYLLVDCPDAT